MYNNLMKDIYSLPNKKFSDILSSNIIDIVPNLFLENYHHNLLDIEKN